MSQQHFPSVYYEWRVDRDLSLSEAAEGIGIERRLLGDIEHNRVFPDEAMERRLRSFYGKPLTRAEAGDLADSLEGFWMDLAADPAAGLPETARRWIERLRGIAGELKEEAARK